MTICASICAIWWRLTNQRSRVNRTACLEAEDQEIIGELQELLQVWEEIQRRFENSKSPSLLYEDIDVLERTLRDYLDSDISRIVINNIKLKERINQYIRDKKGAPFSSSI